MQTAECSAAIEHLSAYLEDPDRHRAGSDAAIKHMSGCPDCQRRIGYLVRALAENAEDRLSCQECQDRLAEYIHAQTIGQAGKLQWYPVVLHLATCPHCAAAYADLADMVALAEGERGVEPPTYPAPRLGFLSAEPRKPWFLDELGRLIIVLTFELVRAGRSPAPAAAGFKSGTRSETVFLLAVPDAGADLAVTITAERTRADPTRCSLSVEVVIPSRGGWPNLGGSEVVLKHGDQVLEAQATDAFGKATFAGIAEADLERLVFEITPATNAA